MGKRMHDNNGSGGGVCVLSPSLTSIYGGGVCAYMGISSVFGRQSLLNFLVIGIYRLDKTIQGRENQKNCNGNNEPFNCLNHACIRASPPTSLKRSCTLSLPLFFPATAHPADSPKPSPK
jgi:hypothetical protein